MAHLIDKSALVAEMERRIKYDEMVMDHDSQITELLSRELNTLYELLSFIKSLEVKDPYEQCVQYDSIKAGIQAHAETYSFNIESELFNQLTKEQQALWRKEIEQACISGGNAGYSLAKDPRYKENLEVKDVDLEKEIDDYMAKEWEGIEENKFLYDMVKTELSDIARHFFELGLKVAQKGE